MAYIIAHHVLIYTCPYSPWMIPWLSALMSDFFSTDKALCKFSEQAYLHACSGCSTLLGLFLFFYPLPHHSLVSAHDRKMNAYTARQRAVSQRCLSAGVYWKEAPFDFSETYGLGLLVFCYFGKNFQDHVSLVWPGKFQINDRTPDHTISMHWGECELMFMMLFMAAVLRFPITCLFKKTSKSCFLHFL